MKDSKDIIPVTNEQARDLVNGLILYCRQHPDFGKFEGSLLSMEEEIPKEVAS